MFYIREQPDPDFASLPHGRYDIVTKNALQKFPEDILLAVLERADFKFVEFVEKDKNTNCAHRYSEQSARITMGHEWLHSSASSN